MKSPHANPRRKAQLLHLPCRCEARWRTGRMLADLEWDQAAVCATGHAGPRGRLEETDVRGSSGPAQEKSQCQ